MTSERVDRILDVIDAGLQSSPEASYGEISYGDKTCVRCRSTDLEPSGEFCGPCRAFLLGDSEDDPAAPVPEKFATVTVRVHTEEFVRRVAELAEIGQSAEEVGALIRGRIIRYRCRELDQWIPPEGA